MTPARPVEHGSLWSAVLERTREAQACGALLPIETEREPMDDAGVRFVLRRVSSLARKAARQRSQPDAPPSSGHAFPVEPELVVGDVSDTHLALLNKFPVIPHHLLLVTRHYVPQEALLDAADFAALSACMHEYDGLAFYNGGEVAGASQQHKHVQLVPLPLGIDCDVPVAALFDATKRGAATISALPFRNAFCRLDALDGEALLARYRELLEAAGISSVERDGLPHQAAPYNLLVTREWMLVVPRSRERFERISINALGFAGSIFVKSDDELARVREAGPMAVLTTVGLSATSAYPGTVP